MIKPRNEYPRPQFAREKWVNLNGTWDFCFDDQDLGLKELWFLPNKQFDMRINVPFVYESELSGIDSQEQHDIIWYKRVFDAPNLYDSQHLILHFGAIDYHAKVFLNGHLVTEHWGGETPFSADITPFLSAEGSQCLCLRVYDPLNNQEIPRGKQFWMMPSAGIWYTRSSGIWQTVWMEVVNNKHIDKLTVIPDLDSGTVGFDICAHNVDSLDCIELKVIYKDALVIAGQWQFHHDNLKFSIDLVQNQIFRTGFHTNAEYLWSPESPNLFDLKLRLIDGSTNNVVDTVSSYFGMRKIHTENGMVYLNNKPYYQKLVLDQGYWPDGLLTAPCDQAYVQDITLAKEMGFNGCRKHQKLEDPRFLYWADFLGFLVWEECSSAPMFTTAAQFSILETWKEIYLRDRNHPCIVTWVPLNESWGVPNIHADSQQQHWAQALYHFLHSLDRTRLVSTNDGWDQVDTDICGIHNYKFGLNADDPEFRAFTETLSSQSELLSQNVSGRPIYAKGFCSSGEPILITECGGIGFSTTVDSDWSYLSVSSSDDFLASYKRLITALYASKQVQGFCYTQLTDIEQEINGLLTYDRRAKFSLETLRAINDSHKRSNYNL
ncbi:glycoside hydrolase family 2 protein [Mobiluncus mulieris]|uniref:Glycoside hydrolase family 2 n=1 Tax=Mobiluncus mulieris TaxID=2052 RepID=A0A7Y0YHA1_9ACTO|nr:sugar-binding domain-containing protein [Mobiluncus mulieris]NMX02489.1 glycoside hydrolase family 2 [Mobiluncus mulieris]NMX12080.1 glycoside hydrolase family 2 [Mobiluncus mulieris]